MQTKHGCNLYEHTMYCIWHDTRKHECFAIRRGKCDSKYQAFNVNWLFPIATMHNTEGGIVVPEHAGTVLVRCRSLWFDVDLPGIGTTKYLERLWLVSKFVIVLSRNAFTVVKVRCIFNLRLLVFKFKLSACFFGVCKALGEFPFRSYYSTLGTLRG